MSVRIAAGLIEPQRRRSLAGSENNPFVRMLQFDMLKHQTTVSPPPELSIDGKILYFYSVRIKIDGNADGYRLAPG